MNPRARIRLITDEGSFEEIDSNIQGYDPLKFPSYIEKQKKEMEKSKEVEAVVTGKAKIKDIPFVLGVMNGEFMMGSMGGAVGEKVTRAIELSITERLPLIMICASGGARMQEGMFSLMQMAKTSAAIQRHRESGLFYLSILTNPTMGGVSASFAMLGDIILAEKDALIGFAGPRVIEQTTGEKLPVGFQKPEFLLEHGIIDGIVERQNMKKTIYALIRLHVDK